MKVSACLVTRGDVDMTRILESLPFDDIVVWDNSKREDYGIAGRYAAIEEAKHDIIYTQDDDLIVTCIDRLLDEYEPGVLTVNYPPPWDIPWVARGSLFDRNLPKLAFRRYAEKFPLDQYFTHYACDGIFALLSETKVVDYGSIDLPHAFQAGRVSTSPGWYDDKRPEITRRCASLA